MSLHHHLLKINEDDLDRIQAMRIGPDLAPTAPVDGEPSRRPHMIVACATDTKAAESVRREIPAVSLSLKGLFRSRP